MNELAGNLIDKSIGFATEKHLRNPLFQSNIVNPANDPIHSGDCPSRCGRMYDFLDAVISPTDGSVWASFVDTCTHTDWNGVVTKLQHRACTRIQRGNRDARRVR
jgi:hypothetical protein